MCERAFTGKVDEGGTCYLNVDCAEGLFCVGCPGICQPSKEIGEPCNSQMECNQAVADCLENEINVRVCTELGGEVISSLESSPEDYEILEADKNNPSLPA